MNNREQLELSWLRISDKWMCNYINMVPIADEEAEDVLQFVSNVNGRIITLMGGRRAKKL